MVTTKIIVRGFSMTFDVSVRRKEFLTIDQADEYVKKEIIGTAQVIMIEHISKDEVVNRIRNRKYLDPTNFDFNKIKNERKNREEEKGTDSQ